MRVAIYARYSTDLQKDRSIEDQVRLCREYATRMGWHVVDVFADRAMSGTYLANRPQMMRLLHNAKDQRYDIVMAEDLDRFSRDQEHLAHIYKQLTFFSKLHTVSQGDITEIHIGMNGTMSALMLRGLTVKIRRGQAGRVRAGYSPGGLSYGYKVIHEFDSKGEPIHGLRTINPEEAEVIQTIFRLYASGMSARKIAHYLNDQEIPSPRGGEWRASTINGNRGRGSGILWNEAYLGKIVYNRVHMVKDPNTGKRLSRNNDEKERVVVDAPILRIIEDDLWKAVQAVKAQYGGSKPARKPKHIFSGLLKCGCCGGSYTIYATDKAGCVRRRDSGTCENDRTVRISDIL